MIRLLGRRVSFVVTFFIAHTSAGAATPPVTWDEERKLPVACPVVDDSALRPAEGRPQGETPFPVRVSENHRFLIDQNGKSFFYLGDTAWELFHRLDREGADLYLRDRAAKRFTVIQAVVLAEHGGLDVPSAYGHLPLEPFLVECIA